MEQIANHLTGPNGGLFALGLIIGGVGGYNFASRTAIDEAKKRITKLEAKVEELQQALMDELRKTGT